MNFDAGSGLDHPSGDLNKLKRFLDIESRLDYESVERLVARWHPYAGMVYFHLLLDSLSEAGMVLEA
jgi:DNA-3-methyladenine glycosylase II